METKDLLKRIRKIEIHTNKLSRNIFAGEYKSAFKGRGMEFSEVREYEPGDPIRDIDWNVTARYAKPYVKVFEEERELTVLLLVDVSSSGLFGTKVRTKRELTAEVAATLAFSCINNNDKVGVLFYSDRIEKYIAPGKGRKHVLHIISEILRLEPQGSGTNLSQALTYASNMQKKSCTIFVMSDFIDDSDYERTLSVVSKKHDVKAIRVYDPHEYQLPRVGLLRVRDAETGEIFVVNSDSSRVAKTYRDHWDGITTEMMRIFRKYGIDFVSTKTDEDYVPALIRLFSYGKR